MRLPIGDVLGFATGATTPESLDSYKVRSNTIRRAQEVGLGARDAVRQDRRVRGIA
jgi:hypothetical protein